ncbi:hypothetical protein [Mesomycoplasma bovoculi]|uniref:Uncharacterized protein n=1 Tax=Mesomycoplasma bovoculi M165/69 TaxID=743966 RepID=W5USI5_9BACT|nr:hypothetical protein [Mesomycoplasma bovoculi]AHH45061.1 hypothetical protein MYB_00245 [Mesomycoplasma bovoculi M165/69]
MKTKYKYLTLALIIGASVLSLSISIPLVLKSNKNLHTIVPNSNLFYQYTPNTKYNEDFSQIIKKNFLNYNDNQIFVLSDKGQDLRYFEINQILNIASNIKNNDFIEFLKSKISNLPDLKLIPILELPYYLNIALSLDLKINMNQIKQYLLQYTKKINNNLYLIVSPNSSINLTFIWNLLYVLSKHNMDFNSIFFSIKSQIQQEVTNFKFNFSIDQGLSSWNNGNNLLAILKFFNNIKISQNKKTEIQKWISQWSDFYEKKTNSTSIDKAEFYYWSEKFNPIKENQKLEITDLLENMIQNQANISLQDLNSITQILQDFQNQIKTKYIQIIQNKTKTFVNNDLVFSPISIKNTFFAYQMLKNQKNNFLIISKLKNSIHNQFQLMIQKNNKGDFINKFNLEELYFYIAFVLSENKFAIVKNQQLTSEGKKLETLSTISFNYIENVRDLFFAIKISSYFSSITKINRTIDDKLFNLFNNQSIALNNPIWVTFVFYFFKKMFNVEISNSILILRIQNALLYFENNNDKKDLLWNYLEQNETLESLFFSINELKNLNDFSNLKPLIPEVRKVVLNLQSIIKSRIQNNKSVQIKDIYYSDQLINLLK